MSASNPQHRANGVTPKPAYATIKDWVAISGISRSKTYELLNTGVIKAVRVGGRTLIDVEAGLKWMGDCPEWGCANKKDAKQ